MNDPDVGALLDDDAPLELPATWRRKEWVPIARERIGEVGAITRLQRVTTDTFFAMTTVYAKRDGRWIDVFENGDQWPLPPTAPRPDSGRPIAMLTGTSGAGLGSAEVMAALTAGVATTAVARMRVSSAVDAHDVRVDERTGAFVALSLHRPEAVRFQLVALDRDGREVDRIDYEDPWSSGRS
jgi:hypothetical protein